MMQQPGLDFLVQALVLLFSLGEVVQCQEEEGKEEEEEEKERWIC